MNFRVVGTGHTVAPSIKLEVGKILEFSTPYILHKITSSDGPEYF